MKAKKKTRMGRPPKPPQDVLSEVLTLRVTKAERERLVSEAAKAGVTVSDLLMLPWREGSK